MDRIRYKPIAEMGLPSRSESRHRRKPIQPLWPDLSALESKPQKHCFVPISAFGFAKPAEEAGWA
jgi:hypothetical protein